MAMRKNRNFFNSWKIVRIGEYENKAWNNMTSHAVSNILGSVNLNQGRSNN